MITIGIDIGTSAVKILALDEQGTVLKIASREYPLTVLNDNWTEQKPEDWLNAAVDGLKELTGSLPNPSDIQAVSFSGQMHGLVVLDENDNIIRPAILWNDQRTVLQCDYLNNTIGRDTLLEQTANIALTGFTAPKILWIKENEPENFKRIKKVMLPKDYIAYKLSGVFATDYSDASGMLLLDVQKQDWSDFMLGLVGINRAAMPKLFKSYEAVGQLLPNLTGITGLPAHTKIVIGGGDQAVGAVGTGTVKDGMCSVSLGTSGVVFVAADAFVVDPGSSAIHSFCHATGRYHMMGVTLAAAASTKWWVEEILGHTDYEAEQKSISETGSNKIFYLPYLNGERTPLNDPYAKGAFVGMSLTTSRTDMTQAVLEGVAFSLRDILERVRTLGANISTSRIIGGGAKSPVWCQIIADVLNVRVEKINSAEGPAFGAAILAMVGAGAFTTVEDACEKLIAVTDVYEPNAASAARYDKAYPVYKKLYTDLKETYGIMAI